MARGEVRDYLLTTGFRLAGRPQPGRPAAGSTYRRTPSGVPRPGAAQLRSSRPLRWRRSTQGYTPLGIPGRDVLDRRLLVEDRLVVAPGPPQADGQPEPGRLEGPRREAAPRACRRGRPTTCSPASSGLPGGWRGPVRRHDRVGQDRAAVGLGPQRRVGRGLTDHPILFTHFALPAGSPHAATGASAKILVQASGHLGRPARLQRRLELGADFNQGRYVDPDNLPGSGQRRATRPCESSSCSTPRCWRATSSSWPGHRPCRCG